MTRQKRDFECPNCSATLNAGATYCGCGWKKRAADKPKIHALGYQQCEYRASEMQCRYPGSTSNDVKGFGRPWYCTAHMKLLMDAGHPSIGAQIVEASGNYKPAADWRTADAAARAKVHAPKFNRHTWKPYPQRQAEPPAPQREPGQDDEEA